MKAAFVVVAGLVGLVVLLGAFFLVAVSTGLPGVFVFTIFVGCALWGVADGLRTRGLGKRRLRTTPPLRAECLRATPHDGAD